MGLLDDGGTWLSTHIWEHYLFTLDKEFLCKFYPVLKGAAEFCMDWLVEKDGKLVTSPGTSPENKYITPDGYVGATSYGNTSDLAMIRECLIDAAEASKVLGVDKSFRKRIKRLFHGCIRIKLGRTVICKNGITTGKIKTHIIGINLIFSGCIRGIICRLRKLPNWRQLVPVHSKLKEMKRPVGVPGGV